MQEKVMNYLYSTGIIIHFFLLIMLFTPRFLLHEPLDFFIERTANYLNYSGGSAKQRYLGRLLLAYLPINNWNTVQINQIPLLTDLDSWQGQGASASLHYKPQQYLGEQPLYAEIGYEENPLARLKKVRSSKEFLAALTHAQAGDVIELMPGEYFIKKRYIRINRSGTASEPITVRSAKLGTVKIKLLSNEGFHVQAPYWVFENLEIQGQCSKENHSYCEHAFHVTGNGHSFVLRNNKLYDFNAIIKVNSMHIKGKSRYPNFGLIENNAFYNTMPRETTNPVNLININSADNWVVRGNLVADFSKVSGNRVSFGAYMKGNSHQGIFENNLIICELALPADLGARIGLSFGGGGTGTQYCRDKNCDSEHTKGIMRNNVILNCSHEVGIYLNKSKETQIYNNLIFNSLGIDVRFKSTRAVIYNNIISGRIKARDSGKYSEKNNLIDVDCISPSREFSGCSFIDWYWDIVNADIALKDRNTPLISTGLLDDHLIYDICNNPVHLTLRDIGPIQYSNGKNCSLINR